MESNIIHNEDCLTGLSKLPDGSVNCCVTSPPYYGLRDYNNDGQIGLEETPEQYVAKLVAVFEQVRRVLRDDGVLWLNLGDSYAGSGKGPAGNLGKTHNEREVKQNSGYVPIGCKPKDLIGIPWMVAFALRSAGWYLRQDIIWHKPNPMPESVTDRCTKAHEYIFLFSKSQRYWYDADAIAEESLHYKTDNRADKGNIRYEGKRTTGDAGKNGQQSFVTINETRNKRSVWTVPTKPFSGAHFATFPEELIVDCIKAGCPRDGIILDPFMGAGTTALVARSHNRNYIGFELNADYIKIAKKRLSDKLGMFI